MDSPRRALGPPSSPVQIRTAVRGPSAADQTTTESEGQKKWKDQVLQVHPLVNSQRRSKAMLTAQRGLCVAAARRFIFDLDKSPTERWIQIAEAYRDHWNYLYQYMTTYINTFSTEESILRHKLKHRYKEIAKATNKVFSGKVYNQEIKSIAQRMNVDTIWIYAWQLLYETESACTSIVAHDNFGVPQHIRSLDWSMDLGPMTIELDVRKNGKTLFIAPTIAYYVGMLTGMKPGAFSVSLNQRDTEGGSLKKNFKMFQSRGWPVGFLIRAVLENIDNYDEAVERLANEPIVAPCYLVVSGVKQNEGVILTRNHTTDERRKTLNTGTLIQTNVDHWEQFRGKDKNLKSFQRLEVCQEYFSKSTPDQVNSKFLWDLLSTEPIANQASIFGAYLCAKTGICDTRIVPIQGRGYTPTSLKELRAATGRISTLFWIPVSQVDNIETRLVKVSLESLSSEIEVVIEQATNLKKHDFFPRTDPYCVIKYEGKAQQTIVHAGTSNPYWSHVMYFSPMKQSLQLKIEVFDNRTDLKGAKRSFGKVKVCLNLTKAQEYWIPLGSERGEDKPELCILVRRPKFSLEQMVLLSGIAIK